MTNVKLFIIYLLAALPLAVLGQVKLPYHQGDDWMKVVSRGGLLRHGDYFIKNNDGVSEFVSFDFVNGVGVGPKATFGKVLKDYSRIEIDEDVKWAEARQRLMAKGVIRYMMPPQYFGFLEVYGGQFTNDFDRYPPSSMIQQSLLCSVFGSTRHKLYEQTAAGIRLYGALSADVQLNVLVGWEKRRQLELHQFGYLFGTIDDTNVPYVHKKPFEGFATDQVVRFDAQIDYMPGRKIMLSDDMTATLQTEKPIFTLRQTSGINGGIRFLSYEFSVAGSRKGRLKDSNILYKASAGFYAINRKTLLMDMKSFNASRSMIQFQRSHNFMVFSLLGPYELSTTRPWLEFHSEWNRKWLYAQVHGVKVTGSPAHEELAAGVSYNNMYRLGMSAAFDDAKFRGISFNIMISL